LVTLVIDQPRIRFGGMLFVRDAVLRFVDQLAPIDKIAVMGIGQGARSVPFTTDRDPIKRAIERTVGQRGVAEEDVLDRLRVLLKAFSAIDAPKTVVLFSDGISIPDEARSAEFERLSAAARTIIYAVQLDQHPVNAGSKDPSGPVETTASAGASTRGRSQSLPDLPFPGGPAGASGPANPRMLDGLYVLAASSGGAVFTAVMNGDYALSRIESELSGYYLIGVETDSSQRNGPRAITVSVERPGVVVRTRHQFTTGTSIKKYIAADAILEALDSPIVAAALPLKAMTITSANDVVIRAEIGDQYMSPARVSLGYVIVDRDGRTVDRNLGNSLLRPAVAGIPSPLQLTIRPRVGPGKYILKLAVADQERVGSVEHTFQK
jgi:VWFA-related protein